LLTKYFKATKWRDRDELVYSAIRRARESDEAVNLGIVALQDRAARVRYHACLLLAYSLRTDLLPAMRERLRAMAEPNHDDLAAAIDAIESGDHNLFVDRDHSGKLTLNVL
jgi:hypothetical protein